MRQIATNADVIGPWVCEKAGGMYCPGNPAIGLLVDGVLKAGIYYDGYTGGAILMHSRCDDQKAPNPLFFWAIFDYPFNQLKVKRVTGIVSAANHEAIRVNEKLGWILETTLADIFPDGDGLIYRMYRSECRWLNLKDRYERVLKKAA